MQIDQIVLFHLFDAPGESLVRLDRIAPGQAFFLAHAQKIFTWFACASMTDKTDNGPAVNRGQLGVKHRQPMTVKQRLDSFERIIQQMLMINLIERQIFHDAFHIEELHDKHAVLLPALRVSLHRLSVVPRDERKRRKHSSHHILLAKDRAGFRD